jgi:diguanylate cyclase
MSYLPYILFSAFCLYCFFGAYVYRLDSKARPNQIFLLICACYGLWAFSYMKIHSSSAVEQVWFWHRVSLPGKVFFSILFTHFFLSFTGAAKKLKYPAYSLYAPGVLFLVYGFYRGGMGSSDFIRAGGVWIDLYSLSDPVDLMYFIWHGLLMLLSVALIVSWKIESEDENEKKQALVMLVCGIPAAVLTFLPFALFVIPGLNFPEVGPAAGLVWLGGIWYAISKYNFLTITPEIAYDTILKSMAEGVILTNLKKQIKWSNSSASLITGCSAEELYGKNIGCIFDDFTQISELSSGREKIYQKDAVFISKTGKKIPVLLTVSEVFRGERRAGFIFSFLDNSERKKAEDRMRYISFHDKLTGLYNRSFVEEEMKRLDTARQLPLSIIICDVDGLKKVNDRHGHATGDKLIQNGALAVKKACRK